MNRPVALLLCAILPLISAGCGAGTDPPLTPDPTPSELAQARSEIPKPPTEMPLEQVFKLEDTFQLQRAVSETAADALGRIGPAAIPQLVIALRDQDPQVRKEAARALARMGAEAAPALQDLIVALKDADESVRRSAAQAIGQIGPAAKDAIPALVEALRDHPPSQSGYQ